MRILSIKIRHSATILPVKVRLGHAADWASMNHSARRNFAVVTQLLQTGLPHPLLLVSRGHLFDHHGCILPLLQRLLVRPSMLQWSWGEPFTHRWCELSW